MNSNHHIQLESLRFSVFSGDDIKKLSVAKICTSETFGPLNNALPGGVYDPNLGPYSIAADPCGTCGQVINCPGHFGHIELCTLVYNPVFMKTVFDILRASCLACFHIQISERKSSILALQLKLVDRGYDIEAQDLEVFKTKDWSGSNAEDHQLENERFFTAKMMEYNELLQHEPVYVFKNTKNTESLRSSIVTTTMKGIVGFKKCIHCNENMKKIKHSYKKLVMYVPQAEMQSFYQATKAQAKEANIKGSNKAILADECREYLRTAYNNNPKLFELLFPILKFCSKNLKSAVDIFFFDILPVTPSYVRLANKLKGAIEEHPQSMVYKKIVDANFTLKSILSVMNKTSSDPSTSIIFSKSLGDTPYEKMYNAWQELQMCVDCLWDSADNRELKSVQGLKQILEKKEGIIRMHMMGKRVNYAARTVITPDPYINVDEIGIPDVFAKKLSYPVPVTTWNVAELRKLVINGPNVHPGANFIQDERGYVQIIPNNDEKKRESMAKTLLTPTERGIKIVHRQLQNGDVLLLNRQPSLHRPSIMGHKARILKGEKTFRLHYSNCKSYNADFDGDEMNAHFPQSELGRSEGYHLVNVSNQYLVPKDGTPLGGLIQDHVISGVRISMRGRFFNREDYQQMVYMGLAHIRGEIVFLPPAIVKPHRLWSGKQVLSTIVINVIPNKRNLISLKSTAKINANAWQSAESRPWMAGGTPLVNDSDMSETEVIIRKGELLVGVLDKTHYGATPYGLIHCMYELYGGNCSTQLLTSLAKLFTYFLQREGFTLGVRDILVLDHAEKKRRKAIKKCRLVGHRTTATALDLQSDVSPEILAEKLDEAYGRDPKFRTMLDRSFKSVLDGFTNKINKICLPAGLLCKFPTNNLQLMVASGAKGSTVNTMQISCLLGQIELEGKRPPLMISGKSLPSFTASETSPKSAGFIDGRFMTGIQPQDFFFHCMAGREGLIDTAVKTSRSGYLQRCLIKHLEGLMVNYDLTVRDSDNSVVQFLYGEDGMDISKTQFLKSKHLEFLEENSAAIIGADLLENLQNDEGINNNMLAQKKKIRVWAKKHGSALVKTRQSRFQQYSIDKVVDVQLNRPNKINKKTGRRKIDEQLVKRWYKCSDDDKQQYLRDGPRCPDPSLGTYKPDVHFGSISEHLEGIMAEYFKAKPGRKKEFIHVMCAKSMHSLAAPGEPVGLLAAQSIGEPSTQMTLNTFHFAGRGEMNVTLGIPRLREILMMASANIKTPSMDIPFQVHSNMEEHAEKLRLKLNRVKLADLLEYINVKSYIVLAPERKSMHTFYFKFLPRQHYKENFGVRPKQILKYMQKSFIKLMLRAIRKSAAAKNTVVDIDEEKGKKRSAKNDQDEDREDDMEPEPSSSKPNVYVDSSDEEEPDGDDDATATKMKMKRENNHDYEEPENDEEKNDANEADDDEQEDAIGNILKDDIDEELDENNETLNVIEENDDVDDYSFDKEHYLWCEIKFHLQMKYKNIDFSTILRDIAQKAVIAQVPMINRSITYQKKGELFLKTDGINIIEMFKYNKILDINRLYTNHVHAMAKTYGIEAAARVIVEEVKGVFDVYGITVDPRHLLLIADYMTFDGTFKPLSRRGMESSASPLQQMSFESSAHFLRAAAVSGRCDNLNSPSSRLFVGRPCKSGTGSFSLITNYDLPQFG